MSFVWPQMIWALALLPAAVATYLWLLRRRKAAVRIASLSVVREAAGRSGLRRHLPPALLLLALGCAILATARPTAIVTLPSQYHTVVLAVDVSLSMQATDVLPDRITAAQTAARAFVEQQPAGSRTALVAFGGSAQLVQPPTRRSDELMAAIDRLQLQRSTATGSGLAVALATLFPGDEIDLESIVFGAPPMGRAPRGRAIDRPPEDAHRRPPPVEPGSYRAGTIVLLSDGRRTTGPDPIEVARLAAERGVRVFTVGFGTREGTTIDFDGWTVAVKLDEETLRQVAAITRGQYFHAGTASDLRKVYEELNARFVLERADTEVTALFAGAAALLAALAAVLSLAWYGRLR